VLGLMEHYGLRQDPVFLQSSIFPTIGAVSSRLLYSLFCIVEYDVTTCGMERLNYNLLTKVVDAATIIR